MRYKRWKLKAESSTLKAKDTMDFKKLNPHSGFRSLFYHWFSGHCTKFFVLFSQDSIVNSLRVAK